jgi:penicillin-binding protein 1C
VARRSSRTENTGAPAQPVAGGGRRRWLRRLRTAGLALLGLVAAAYALAWIVPLPERLSLPPSAVVEWRDGGVAHVFVSTDGRYRPEVRPEELDPAYLAALFRLEDRRFHTHLGVDPLAVARAALSNVTRGRRVSGASTLTMQLVRVLEPRPRHLGSKIVEAFRAVQLELRLSKREILAAYLQYLPFGGNVEGVEAASLAYFGHRPTALSPAEIALLLAIPQDPNRRAPGPGHEARLRAARDLVAQRLAGLGALPHGRGPDRTDAAIVAEIAATPVPAAPRPFPRAALHAAIWLRAQHPGAARVRSTLDAGTQKVADRLASGAAPELAREGIFGGAIVVVDARTGEVQALVGNLDFWDEAHGGQVIAFDAPRSPGSALKPVIYGMAIERGIAGPRTLVTDVPTSYGSYAPRNFDGKFDGLVVLEDALSRSLNVPFVNLLEQLGVESFLGKLRSMGVRSLDPRPGQYGLSAAVGGIELTPLEVAGVYTALARGGDFVELATSAGGPGAPDVRKQARGRVMAPGAAWLVAQALAIRDRPDFPERRKLTGAPDLRWKTGTSFGHRDAWAAGWSGTHAAVVWLGNVDGTPSRALVGGEVAAPILFDLLEALQDRAAPPTAQPMPADLTYVEVCALSGHVPGPACKERRLVPALRTAVPTEPCPLHRRVEVDLETGKAVTPGCRAGHPREARDYVVWPSNVRSWLRSRDRELPEPPDLHPDCARGGAHKPPSIVSPQAGQVALLAPGVPLDRQEIPLEAEGDVGKLSWFVDGEFIGSARADERLWWRPAVGRHDVVVTDEAGLSAKRELVVRERGR